ncbi:endonuclease I [Anaeroplasma bactoclasticum]|jgi:endonuclease I|uniref:Endonuclease I n=1 Tax=Anaeroplasma bactoclasticum TaxID=2088 RepID=A0A397S1Q0_9MOLU|nr:endonuclease [Anaeroplasma bactoclasticum]RIA78335.1 endonuclease I [Anaeroplasma bactoclasticum]
MKIKLILPLLGVLILASCGGTSNTTTNVETTTETTTDISTTTKEEITLAYRELPEDVNNYYSNVNTNLEKDEFVASITSVISQDYIKYSYSDAWDILEEADEDPYNKDNIVCIYTGLSIPKNAHGTWNREHTWPKSHGFASDTNPAYTDCHHLTATQAQANNARGDLDFDEVALNSGTVEEDAYGNKWINNVCYEPRDEAKGDCARAIFYMMARYNDTNLDLTISEKIPTSSGEAKIGKLSTLIKWHYQDPVSFEEINRNEIIYKHQKNRNPFIDHPEWVNKVFDSSYLNLSINKEKVKALIDDINNLPSNVTLEDEEAVNTLVDRVKALNAQEKLYVNNYSILSEAKYLIDYLKGNSLDNDAYKTFDFSSVSGEASYKKDVTFSISDFEFYASACYVAPSDFRLGTNGKKVSDVALSTIGAEGSGAYLKSNFSTEGLCGVTVNFTGTHGPVSKGYIIGVSNGEYKVLYSGALGQSSFSATFDEFNGEFIFAIAGDNPRVVISSISIYVS